MAKYIDADKLWNRLISVSENDWVGFDTIDEVLSGMPAADVVDVRHGRWLKGDEMADYPRVPYKPWETYCSCCGEIKEQINDNFCGNCGASMYEERKND